MACGGRTLIRARGGRSPALAIREGPEPSRRDRAVSALREFVPRIVPLGLLILGLAIALASLGTDVETAYSARFSGTIVPTNQTIPIGPWSAQYLQVNLPVGACPLRIYLATSGESVNFNSTGERPTRWTDCTSRSVTTAEEVVDLILVNDGTRPEPYNVTVEAYSIRMPYGWIALPGTFLAMTGLILLVPRLVLQQATKMKDDLDRWKRK